jgi:transposase-like protein
VDELQDRTSDEITCPHCRRIFTAELMQGSTARHSGYKCPHCRLFVPLERRTETSPPHAA